MSRKAEIAESEPKPQRTLDKFSEETLIEMKKYVHAKRMQLQAHPECPDYQAIYAFEQHVDRRLTEIAWNRYRKEKGIE